MVALPIRILTDERLAILLLVLGSRRWHEIVEVPVIVTQFNIKANLSALLILSTEESRSFLVLLGGELQVVVLACLLRQHELELFIRTPVTIRALGRLNCERLSLAFGRRWPLHVQEVLFILLLRGTHLGFLPSSDNRRLIIW